MPNGTGKTTTMGLIRHLIMGTDLEESEVRDYAPQYDAESGRFSMGFATDSRRFRIHMDLDYDLGTVRYRHSYPQREGGGANNGHYLPLELAETLTESFVDLFVFNGELTDSFIETDEDKAEEALKIVNRLDRIESQKESIERVVEKQQEDKGAKTEQGLNRNRTELEERRQRLEDLENQRDLLKQEISEHDQEIERLKDEREQIIAEDKEALQLYRELDEDIQQLRTELHTEAANTLTEMRSPANLSESFRDDFEELLEHMTILQLPKATSEEFFSELASSETCICGRELSEEHRQAIRENAQGYLSDEDIGVLNTLKERLRNVEHGVDFDDRFKKLSQTRSALKRKEMQQDGLNLDDPELEQKKQELTERIENHKSDREEKKDILEMRTTDDKGMRDRFDLTWEDNIPEAKREVERYRRKVQEATGTVEFSKKAEKLDQIFDDSIDRSLRDLKQQQISRTNERLLQILGLSEVQIESIDDSIKLEGKSGASEGQTLSVAYAYLSTLFEGSAVDMPFVIDSPAVSLDHKVRREVASIVSDLFDQLIAFVISTEKEGFVGNIHPKAVDGNPDIRFYTIHKTDTPGVVESHTDKEYFMKFTSEEEEGRN
jgi:hypothetical protein